MATKRRRHVTKPNSQDIVPLSTQRHRDKAIKQQVYISQEKALGAESLRCSGHFFLTFLPYNKTAAEGWGTLFLGTCDLEAFGLAAIAIMKRRLVDRGQITLRLEEYYDNGTKRR